MHTGGDALSTLFKEILVSVKVYNYQKLVNLF